jgi:hypothetical protein
LLRKQKGFQDEITFVTPNGTEVVGISLWDEKEDAEAYGRRAYPAVLIARQVSQRAPARHRVIEVPQSDWNRRSTNMELDKALQFAVIVAWEDLSTANQALSVRVEYQGNPGTPR